MFARGTSGSMRGPRVKTPLMLLLLLLLTRTVICQSEDDGANAEAETPEEEEEVALEPDGDPGDAVSETQPTVSDATSPTEILVTDDFSESTVDPDFTAPTEEPEEEGLSPIIILIPVVLVVVIIAMIVCCIFIRRRWNQKGRNQELRKEDPYLDGSSTEKVPMPMFEEDVPSVLELEMEELDQWMKKDALPAEGSQNA